MFILFKIKMHELPVQSNILGLFVAFVEYIIIICIILDYLVGFAL